MKKVWFYLFALLFIVSCQKEQLSKQALTPADQTAQLQPITTHELNTADAASSRLSCAEIQAASLANLSERSNCGLINSNRMLPSSSSQRLAYVTYEFICDLYPAFECFDIELEIEIEREIAAHATSIIGPVHPLEVYITSKEISLFLSDIIDTSDLFPFIDSPLANEVYKEISCQILDELDNQPPLPPSEAYDIDITYLQTDYTLCGGSEESFVFVHYDIFRLE